MDLDNLVVYRRAMEISETIWQNVDTWPRFAQRTVGEQIVRSADSISANISEAHGRHHFKDRQRFCYYSRGSLQETLTWIRKAQMRGYMDPALAEKLSQELIKIRKMLNGYIRSMQSYS
jgi:four helix bundle protein